MALTPNGAVAAQQNPYARQLYDKPVSAATVGSSSAATQGDIGSYLSNQNNQISQGQVNVPTTSGATGQATATNTYTNARQYPGSLSPAQSGLQARKNYSVMSPWDRALNETAQTNILNHKDAWDVAAQTGNRYGKTDAHVQANLERAKSGGYIDPVGDGSGYLPFGYDKLSVYDRTILSKDDQDTMLLYKVQYEMAGTPEEKAAWNKMAEELRAKYGYSGGPDGSQYNKLDPWGQAPVLPTWDGDGSGSSSGSGNGSSSGGNGNAFVVGGVDMTELANAYKPTAWNAPTFSYQADYTLPGRRNNYMDQSADAYGRLINGDYDPNTDPVYRAYENIFTRNADAAANRAMAQSAANTGGIASSYAAAIADSSRNAEMRRVQDAIPALADSYFNRVGAGAEGMNRLADSAQNAWQFDIDTLRNAYNTDIDYSWRYYKALNDYGYNGVNDARNFAYTVGNGNRDFNYGVHRDNIGDILNIWGKQMDVIGDQRSMANSNEQAALERALQELMQQRELDAAAYRQFVQQGLITPTF